MLEPEHPKISGNEVTNESSVPAFLLTWNNRGSYDVVEPNSGAIVYFHLPHGSCMSYK